MEYFLKIDEEAYNIKIILYVKFIEWNILVVKQWMGLNRMVNSSQISNMIRFC